MIYRAFGRTCCDAAHARKARIVAFARLGNLAQHPTRRTGKRQCRVALPLVIPYKQVGHSLRHDLSALDRPCRVIEANQRVPVVQVRLAYVQLGSALVTGLTTNVAPPLVAGCLPNIGSHAAHRSRSAGSSASPPSAHGGRLRP